MRTKLLAKALDSLGERTYATIWHAGDIVSAQTLTSRERDVARLVARGFTNRRISDALVISHGTVTVHIKHILAKLNFDSRVQIAAWVTQQAWSA
jgi:non-specific serine/threonine protein kinase